LSLREALSVVNGWETIGGIPMDQSVVDALKLDDYINQSYSKGSATVSLYIGYYYTGGKIGAAHDPLVCFPGQGWIVKGKDKGNLEMQAGQTISYSTMIADKGQERDLILYWFQSYNKTNSNTFAQKINALWVKLTKKGEDNAFVRISIRIGNESGEMNKDIILDFVRAFYPVFLDYIQN